MTKKSWKELEVVEVLKKIWMSANHVRREERLKHGRTLWNELRIRNCKRSLKEAGMATHYGWN